MQVQTDDAAAAAVPFQALGPLQSAVEALKDAWARHRDAFRESDGSTRPPD
jgi:hypothetical protein